MPKKLLLLLLISAVAGFFFFDLHHFFDLAYFQAQRSAIETFQSDSPLLLALIYLLIYVVVTALSLPGAAVLTLVGGALFGLGWGLLLVSFASSIGATLAFLIARWLLRDWVQRRFGSSLGAINRGIERDGNFYLFTLRLVPVFPFFVINLVMALTPMRAWPFYWVSQLGMLAGTAVYVNAGTQLAQIESAAGLLTPSLLLSFAALGLFPWLARWLVGLLQQRRALAKFERPKGFDHNLLVVGAGSGGLVSAYIAAAVKADVALIERDRMGGDCLNTGCVPSKALIRSARIGHYLKRAEEFGWRSGESSVDFKAVMARVKRIIKEIEPHDSVERYEGLGVQCVSGEAKFLSPWEVEVDGQRRSARNLILATGGRPIIPNIPGIDRVEPLTSDTVWELEQLPKRLLVMGGGPIGCELAQAFQRLGSQVTMVVRSRLLPKEDEDVAALVGQIMSDDGIEIFQQCKAVSFESGHGAHLLQVESSDGPQAIDFDRVLVAAGRRANTENLGLEALGVECRENGTVVVDDYMRTACPTLYACGDVAGPYQFTHVASHQAWYASVNALFGGFKRFKVDYSVIPWVTFVDPEVARVGLNELEAKASGIDYEITRYGIDDLDRAIADSENRGFIKVLTVPGKDKILGVTIVGYRAGELISEWVLAMKHGLGLGKILGTIHPYPTLAEANKYSAGEWRRAHQPERVLAWVARFHQWRKGR